MFCARRRMKINYPWGWLGGHRLFFFFFGLASNPLSPNPKARFTTDSQRIGKRQTNIFITHTSGGPRVFACVQARKTRNQTKRNQLLKTFWQMQTAQFRMATFFNTQQFCATFRVQSFSTRPLFFPIVCGRGGAWSGSTLQRRVADYRCPYMIHV